MNPNELIDNVEAYPPEELAKYEGQYVAWSEDGREILASAATLPELFAQLKRLGTTKYVIDSVWPADEVDLSGVGL